MGERKESSLPPKKLAKERAKARSLQRKADRRRKLIANGEMAPWQKAKHRKTKANV